MIRNKFLSGPDYKKCISYETYFEYKKMQETNERLKVCTYLKLLSTSISVAYNVEVGFIDLYLDTKIYKVRFNGQKPTQIINFLA